MTLLYIAIAILLIGLLVLVHEIGHYTAARLTGVPVHEFAIGFGKRIFTRKRKGIIYSIRLIPFGGFVAFADAEDEGGIDSYYRQPVWKRLVVTVSGPFMNFVLAFLIIIVFAMAGGLTQAVPYVGAVEPGKPAAEAGILPDDRILRINGVDIGDNVGLITQTINEAEGKPVDVLVERGGQRVSLVMVPEYREQEQRYLIGITPRLESYYMGFGQSVAFSGAMMVDMVRQLLQFLFGLVTQGKGGDQVASPIGIVSVMTETARVHGIKSFIDIAVFLSVNLGLFNLLPLPALDGSKVIFLLVEAIRRKPIPPEKEGLVQTIGFGLFILLFIFLAGRDIARLIGWIQ
jgi:regulator of sigma E protease